MMYIALIAPCGRLFHRQFVLFYGFKDSVFSEKSRKNVLLRSHFKHPLFPSIDGITQHKTHLGVLVIMPLFPSTTEFITGLGIS